MAKLAVGVGVCVVFSLFLLASARHLPLKEDTPQESVSVDGFTVLPLRHKTPFRIRFPSRCRHHLSLRGPRMVPYGNDMIPSDEVDQTRVFRSRVSALRGLLRKSDFGFPVNRHFVPAALESSRDGGLFIGQGRIGSVTTEIRSFENEMKVERAKEAEAAPEGGFKKWFAEILNGF